MVSRLLTRSAISPRPRTDVRLSLVVDVVMIDLPNGRALQTKGFYGVQDRYNFTLHIHRRWFGAWAEERSVMTASRGGQWQNYLELRGSCGTRGEGLCCSRRASPNDVILTIQRPFTSSLMMSPRLFASSQTGSLGHEVRQ